MTAYYPDQNLHFNQILYDVRASTPRQALEALAHVAREARSFGAPLDASALSDRLWEREQQATSGIGEGVAIPHVRLPTLKEPYLVFARLAQDVDFDAVDGMPVNIMILLLSPEKDGPLHLQRLSRISRMMRDDHLRTCLRGAESLDALQALLYNSRRLMAA